MADKPAIRVKFVGNYAVRGWLRQFPGGGTTWGRCEFLFDTGAGDYDWFVVYNDFPDDHREETLSCPRRRTLLVTMEPPTIKSYGRAYTAQFGHVLTSQPEWALPHPGRIYSQPGLQWFYGLGRKSVRTLDQMAGGPLPEKNRVLSTICSAKRQRHTLHNYRYTFTQALKARVPYMEIYGHGVREMDDKAEALDGFRYHVAVENYRGIHHWTEKLADVFLAGALPFYYGCPNAGDYFPEESFIPVDIHDVGKAQGIIERAIRDGEYEKRLPYILEARRRVLYEYNQFAVLAREIGSRTAEEIPPAPGGTVLSRRLLRKRHPAIALRDFYGKCRARILNAFTP